MSGARNLGRRITSTSPNISADARIPIPVALRATLAETISASPANETATSVVTPAPIAAIASGTPGRWV